MLLELMLCLWLAAVVAHFAPETSLGRACRRWVVERPAAWLAELTPARLGFVALLAVTLVALAPVMPLETLFLAAGDLTAYLEVLGAVTLVAVRSRSLRVHVRTFLAAAFRTVARAGRSPRSPARERRPRPKRSPAPGSGEDGRPGAWAPAFA